MSTVVSSPSILQQQQQQIIPTLPPADKYTRYSPRRSSNRYSWSSSSSSPTDTTTNPRRFKLPVRVSTDLTSFASPNTSPESRRRSASLASVTPDPITKRRSRALYQQNLEEEKALKSPLPSPSARVSTPPPPSYEGTTESAEAKKTSPPSPTTKKSKLPVSPSKSRESVAPPPAYQEKSRPVSPEIKKETPVVVAPVSPKTTPPQPTKMSSSPEPQKTNTMVPTPGVNQPRGFDFSAAHGDTKLTAQTGHSLPLPNLSGKGNGPVGNLLKGPVDDEGNLKAAALTVGIKLDLEAEVHLSARVRGDILVGLY